MNFTIKVVCSIVFSVSIWMLSTIIKEKISSLEKKRIAHLEYKSKIELKIKYIEECICNDFASAEYRISIWSNVHNEIIRDVAMCFGGKKASSLDKKCKCIMCALNNQTILNSYFVKYKIIFSKHL